MGSRTTFGSAIFFLAFFALISCDSNAQYPFSIDANNTTADRFVILNFTSQPASVTINMDVVDPDFPDEGTLFINGNGPIPLFGAQGISANDSGNVPSVLVSIETDGSFWVNGNNTLTFNYVRTAGYAINSLTVDYVEPIQRPAYAPPAVKPADESLQRARIMHKRLVGVTFPLDHPTIQAMAADIDNGDAMAAASKAVADPDFYNITIRNFAVRLSNKDESRKVPLNDLAATFMGVAYNDMDARVLLSGDFLFQGDASQFGAGTIPTGVDAIQKSNAHYEAIENIPQLNISSILRQAPQMLVNSSGGLSPNPDPAGVITSRAFARDTMFAGTNRAAVQHTLRKFLCGDLALTGTSLPEVNIRDGSLPDYRIGMDVDRAPGGDVPTFKSECRTCHGGMDGLRPAFAKWNYFALDDENVAGFLKHTSMYPASNGDETETDIKKDSNDIVFKMNQNDSIMPFGFEVVDEQYRNFYTANPYFGFRESPDAMGNINGSGTEAYGAMLAGSEAFSRCMAKRAFFEVCQRPVVSEELLLMDQVANEFEQQGYNLKYLFQRISIIPNCAGL